MTIRAGDGLDDVNVVTWTEDLIGRLPSKARAFCSASSSVKNRINERMHGIEEQMHRIGSKCTWSHWVTPIQIAILGEKTRNIVFSSRGVHAIRMYLCTFLICCVLFFRFESVLFRQAFVFRIFLHFYMEWKMINL